MLETLNLLELKDLEVEVWVNYWDRQNELTLADVENFLGKKIAGTITCDYKQASVQRQRRQAPGGNLSPPSHMPQT